MLLMNTSNFLGKHKLVWNKKQCNKWQQERRKFFKGPRHLKKEKKIDTMSNFYKSLFKITFSFYFKIEWLQMNFKLMIVPSSIGATFVGKFA